MNDDTLKDPNTSPRPGDAGRAAAPVDVADGAYPPGASVKIEHEAHRSPRAGQGVGLAQPPEDGSSTYTQENAHAEPIDYPGATPDTSSDRAPRTRQRLHEVREFTEQARTKAEQQWREGRQKFEESREQVTRQLREHKDRLETKASNVADNGRRRLASGIRDAAGAARAAAEDLKNRDDKTIAGYAESAADQLDRLHDYFDRAELRDLARDAADFTRRRPEWVLGGMFVAGLAAARFLKADRPGRSQFRAEGPPADADPSLFRDLVDDQREQHYSRSGGSAAFGEDAPVGLHDPAPVPPPAPAAPPATIPPAPTPGASVGGMSRPEQRD